MSEIIGKKKALVYAGLEYVRVMLREQDTWYSFKNNIEKIKRDANHLWREFENSLHHVAQEESPLELVDIVVDRDVEGNIELSWVEVKCRHTSLKSVSPWLPGGKWECRDCGEEVEVKR